MERNKKSMQVLRKRQVPTREMSIEGNVTEEQNQEVTSQEETFTGMDISGDTTDDPSSSTPGIRQRAVSVQKLKDSPLAWSETPYKWKSEKQRKKRR